MGSNAKPLAKRLYLKLIQFNFTHDKQDDNKSPLSPASFRVTSECSRRRRSTISTQENPLQPKKRASFAVTTTKAGKDTQAHEQVFENFEKTAPIIAGEELIEYEKFKLILKLSILKIKIIAGRSKF